MLITDCHIHIEPLHMIKLEALSAIQHERADAERVLEIFKSPLALLRYMDEIGIGRVVLINYVAPDVMGVTPESNRFIAEYSSTDRSRLLPCGGLHPRYTDNAQRDMDELLRMGVRLIKIHPPHQLFYPNDYLNGVKELEIVYRTAEANGIPVMFHTGTSIFPGARNKYGDPIYVDDVAVDFPKLKILLAHGGRPLWMDTAFFLIRRHPNVFLDISSIPPRTLLQYFPRLEQIAHKTLFGTDWPGPGVPEIARNLAEVRSLPISDEAKEAILSRNALQMWPE